MIRMHFSLRFQTQLRRVRPEIYGSLEKSIIASIESAGGTVGVERRVVSGSFDEDAPGFWLNLLTLLEKLLQTLSGMEEDLYGHIIILGSDLSAEEGLQLSRELLAGGTGIWCDGNVRQGLSPYAEFLPAGQSPSSRGDYAAIQAFIPPASKSQDKLFPYGTKILEILSLGPPRNAVLMGRRFIGKREGLKRFLDRFQPDIPPILVRFGAGGTGLSCFADALTPALLDFIRASQIEADMDELSALKSSIVRERFRDQKSDYLLRTGQRFLQLLFSSYGAAAIKRGGKPLLVLENIEQADAETESLFIDLFQRYGLKERFLVYGAWSHQGDLNRGEGGALSLGAWSAVFPRVLQIPLDASSAPAIPSLPVDLWEIAYALFLFRRYFPSNGYLELLQESGINPQTLSRALDFFIALGIVDSREDPQPRIPDFLPRAERLLGERITIIRSMTWARILALVNRGSIKSSFNLLKLLTYLGGAGSDALFLDAILSDAINKTSQSIEDAIGDNSFQVILGEERAPALGFIFRTYKALAQGSEEDIRAVFSEPPEDESSFQPLYRAQSRANFAGFYLGIRDAASASESVKSVLSLGQNQRDGRGLAQGYRLFSLAHILRRRIEDGIEYYSFALENAQRLGNLEELAIAAYYAAGASLLYGDVAKAALFAFRADEAAISAGREEWSHRIRFLLGRIRFENGLYREAREIFEDLAERIGPLRVADSDRDMTLAAWIYRTDTYIKDREPRKPITMNADARLFELEAACFKEEFPLAADLADHFPENLIPGEFLYIEQPDWRSGFSQCELFLFLPQELFRRIIAACRALCKSRQGKLDKSAGEEALEGIMPILREERQSQLDPNDSFYFYSYYRILEEIGAPDMDIGAAISMASKYLQRRAGRILDEEAKRNFLTQNIWNSALRAAAEKHNLL